MRCTTRYAYVPIAVSSSTHTPPTRPLHASYRPHKQDVRVHIPLTHFVHCCILRFPNLHAHIRIHVTLLYTENYMDPILGTQNQVMSMGSCYVQLLARAILCSSRGAVQFTAVSHGNRSRKHIIRENIFRLTSHSC